MVTILSIQSTRGIRACQYRICVTQKEQMYISAMRRTGSPQLANLLELAEPEAQSTDVEDNDDDCNCVRNSDI